LRSEIARPIKINVLRKWLHGQSRGEIRKEEGISTGTVSHIVKEYRQNDNGFDLLRQLAVMLRSEGYSIESFACLVRIREMLKTHICYQKKLKHPEQVQEKDKKENEKNKEKKENMRILRHN
jgi:hypothetical protein